MTLAITLWNVLGINDYRIPLSNLVGDTFKNLVRENMYGDDVFKAKRLQTEISYVLILLPVK